MLIQNNRKQAVIVKHNVCPVHRQNPNLIFAGCTCSSTYSSGTVEEFKPSKIPNKKLNKKDA